MVVLVGFMGAGKTVVGRGLARHMEVSFVDLDEEIERRAGRSIAEIFAAVGEPAFRDLERSALEAVLHGRHGVVSAGGGIVDDAVNRTRLQEETVVFLDVSLDEALARIGDPETRPMLRSVDAAELLARRRPLYASVADATVDTDGRTVDEIVEETLAKIDFEVNR